MINFTIEKYEESGIALIQKIPTPITPIKINPENRQITLAYFEKKSTVDYIGVVQGVPVCFDAKECVGDTFAMQNIHAHQMDFMSKFEQQQGISFILLYYTHRDEAYYIPFRDMKVFYERSEQGGRKSFRMDELDSRFFLENEQGILVPYLEGIQKDLMTRD